MNGKKLVDQKKPIRMESIRLINNNGLNKKLLIYLKKLDFVLRALASIVVFLS